LNILQFLFGKNLTSKEIDVKPGTFYLDVETKELFFDDPSNTSSGHNKVIDTGTLIYKVTETITFSPSDDTGSGDSDTGSGDSDTGSGDSETGSTSAVLGVAVLGTMTLGTE
jgi:hypothetical protein